MDSNCVSEEGVSYKEEIAHVEEFNGALKELLGKVLSLLMKLSRGLRSLSLLVLVPWQRIGMLKQANQERSHWCLDVSNIKAVPLGCIYTILLVRGNSFALL